jgi:nicotinate-nucleotide pyrophosphorylase
MLSEKTWAMATIVRWSVTVPLVKDDGIIAGVEFAKMIFHYVDSNLTIDTL